MSYNYYGNLSHQDNDSHTLILTQNPELNMENKSLAEK